MSMLCRAANIYCSVDTFTGENNDKPILFLVGCAIWSSPRIVDTEVRRSRLLVLHRGNASQRGATALTIVKKLDVLEDRCTRPILRGQVGVMDQSVLQRGETEKIYEIFQLSVLSRLASTAKLVVQGCPPPVASEAGSPTRILNSSEPSQSRLVNH